MEIIAPLTITEAMLTASNVAEDDYDEWTATAAEMSAFNTSTFDWSGIAVDSLTGDVYTCVITDVNWSGIAVDEKSKTIYSCVDNGYIYFKLYSGSSFSVLEGGTSRRWTGVAVNTQAGYVYACVFGGYIYRKILGVTGFEQIDSTIRNWHGITVDSLTGDVYACVDPGYIYKQTAGAGAFVAITSIFEPWASIAINKTTKDIYAIGNDIYKRTAGAGSFVAMGFSSKEWVALAVNYTTGDLYGAVPRDGLYIYGAKVYSLGDRVISTTTHSIYESLGDFNVKKDPATDSLSASPSWIKVSNTNKWKMFDFKTSSATIVNGSIIKVITPGIKVTAIGLIEVEATRITVSTTSPTTSTFVDITDEVIDVVFKNENWSATTIFTIIITNSSTPVKCGELIMGTPQDLGFTQYGVDIGILDYSVKETDSFGVPGLIVREFAKRGNFDVLVEQTNLNAVYRTLAKYRATNVLWIGDDDIAPLIIFGWCRKFNVVLPSYEVNICSLEIEGMV